MKTVKDSLHNLYFSIYAIFRDNYRTKQAMIDHISRCYWGQVLKSSKVNPDEKFQSHTSLQISFIK